MLETFSKLVEEEECQKQNIRIARISRYQKWSDKNFKFILQIKMHMFRVGEYYFYLGGNVVKEKRGTLDVEQDTHVAKMTLP